MEVEDDNSITSTTGSSVGRLSVCDYDDDDAIDASIYSSTTATQVQPPIPALVIWKKPRGWGKRYTLALIAFFGFICVYAMRFNMSIAIVAMVINKPKPIDNATLSSTTETPQSNEVCEYPGEERNESSKPNTQGEFDWDEDLQGLVLASFFWGYIWTQIPSGIIVSKIGGKWPLVVGIAVSALMTLFTPIAARTNVGMLMFCRFVEGLAQGFIFPAMHQMLALWAPPNERSRMTSLSYSGCQFGAALSMITSGYIITGSGWSTVFYFTGSVTLIWCAVWCYFVFNSPSEHPTISAAERNYIVSSIGPTDFDKRDHIPWVAILTSWPVWVITLCELCHTWGFYTLLLELPTYLKFVLFYDIEDNSWLSAAPDMLMWVYANCATFLVDFLITKRVAKPIRIRKTCHIISEGGAGLLLIGAAFVGCNRTGAVLLLTLAIGAGGGICGTYLPNQVEIANNYAGIIMGISNTVGNFAGFLVTVACGAMTKGHASDQHHWRYVFFTASGLYFLGVIIFVTFATSKEQSWNRKRRPYAPIGKENLIKTSSTIVTMGM